MAFQIHEWSENGRMTQFLTNAAISNVLEIGPDVQVGLKLLAGDGGAKANAERAICLRGDLEPPRIP